MLVSAVLSTDRATPPGRSYGPNHGEKQLNEAVDQLRADYDAVPYESHAFPLSAPGHLASVAYLFGLDPVDVSTARVLEIGCSAGGNVIPFAAWHPQAQVVGIDLSPVQVEQGRRHIEALGLSNLQLLQGDIATMDRSALGTFDFIICHGVYSWVPENVQEAILSAFDSLLAPGGVAYISYNVYPGWKSKEIVRDAMMLRGGDRKTPEERLSYARGMIDFFEQVAPADSVVAKALADYREISKTVRDFYIHHEYLESFNSPCYFLDFGRRTEPYRLTYLGDSAIHTMFAKNYGEKISGPLLQECGHSQVLVEQYLDFFTNRTFRHTLLVHGDSARRVSYNPDRTRFGRLHFATSLPRLDGETNLDNSPQQYGSPGLTARDPGVKAALDALNASWPWTLSRQELLDAVYARLDAVGVQAAPDQEAQVDHLLELLLLGGAARIRLDTLSPAPTTSPLQLDDATRRMAEFARDKRQDHIFNRWHETVWVSPVELHVLPLLDGTRDRDALVDEAYSAVRRGLIGFTRDGRQLTTEAELQEAAAEYIDALPQRLTEMKLLRLDGSKVSSTGKHAG